MKYEPLLKDGELLEISVMEDTTFNIIEKIRAKQKEHFYFHGTPKTVYLGKQEYKELDDFAKEHIKFNKEWEELTKGTGLNAILEPEISKEVVETVMGLKVVKVEEESYLEVGL